MNFFIWAIVLTSIACMLFRPRGLPEWAAASGGAVALGIFGFLSPPQIVHAIGRGNDVYAFLAGMMALAEAARITGLFTWIAALAVRAAAGSRLRMFGLIYAACVAVTTLLSNDATAVVLTPAVAAAVRRARVPARPYLFACALVANAASFVLPISNPANLVVFGRDLPPLGTWLALFIGPSVGAIVVTFVVLAIVSRGDLRGGVATEAAGPPLTGAGRVALVGVIATAVAVLVASTRGLPLGATTAIAALLVIVAVGCADRTLAARVFGGVTWSVLPLVAGLFILVAGVDRTGVLQFLERATATLGVGAPSRAIFAAGIATALASNLTNNLPAGLLSGLVLEATPHARTLAEAMAIGIDLGPNLSISGSLATVLWLVALRREGMAIDALAFLRVGALAMPPALLAALAIASLQGR